MIWNQVPGTGLIFSVSSQWIPNSERSVFQIPDSTSKYLLYFEFHEQIFLKFWILDYLTWGESKYQSKNHGRGNKPREKIIKVKSLRFQRQTVKHTLTRNFFCALKSLSSLLLVKSTRLLAFNKICFSLF